MKNVLIIILISVVIAGVGCRDTHCPAFPLHLVDYFPYHIGDVLKFTNPENDTVSLKIYSVETSGESSFAWNCACSCGFSHSFKAEEMDTFGFQIEGSILGGDNYIAMSCNLSDYYYYSDNLFFSKENVNPHVPESSHIFGDTLIVEYNEAGRFNQAIVVKGEGLIEFFDLKDNYTWKKVKK